MKAVRHVTALLFMLSAVGCAPATSQGLLDALAPARALGPTAECAAPCKAEWERAQYWVAKHSVAKVKTSTEVLIETEEGSSATGFDSMYSFSVLKEPLGGERYRVAITPRCHGNWGCSPKEPDVVAAFVYYVATGNDVITADNIASLRGIK